MGMETPTQAVPCASSASEAWHTRRKKLAQKYQGHQMTWTEHPYVVKVEGYRGGRPIILGSSVPVQTIVIYHLEHQMPVVELLEGFPQLCEAQIYDALSYYYDHRQEIDQHIALEGDTAYWMDRVPPGKPKVRE